MYKNIILLTCVTMSIIVLFSVINTVNGQFYNNNTALVIVVPHKTLSLFDHEPTSYEELQDKMDEVDNYVKSNPNPYTN